MAYFQTKKFQCGLILERRSINQRWWDTLCHSVYYTAILYILLQFGYILWSFGYVFPVVGMLYQEKSNLIIIYIDLLPPQKKDIFITPHPDQMSARDASSFYI
jgi:hypothetical protein